MTREPTPRPGTTRPGRDEIDARAWVEEHGDALYRLALARLGRHDLAEDIVQETFLAALSARDRFRGRSGVRTWLVAILRRKIVDLHRRGDARGGQAAPPGPFFDDAGHWADPPGRWDRPGRAIEAVELRDALDGCIGELPDRLAEPFVLREVQGIAAEEVAGRLGLTPGNLRVRLHRARLLLRRCLEIKWFDA